jgi:hypothetical protein
MWSVPVDEHGCGGRVQEAIHRFNGNYSLPAEAGSHT